MTAGYVVAGFFFLLGIIGLAMLTKELLRISYYPEFVSIEKVTKHDYKITISHIPSYWGQLLKADPFITEYVGSCAVWHRLPNHECPGLDMESYLYSIWNKEVYHKNRTSYLESQS